MMGAQRNAPSSSPKKRSTTLQCLFDLDSRKNNTNKVADSSYYGSLQVTDEDQVISIISHCSLVTDPSVSCWQHDLKRLKLTQLLSHIKSSKKPLSIQIISPLMAMISTNLFRPLPPPSNPSIIISLPDDEELASSPALSWPHLQVIYDILLRVVINVDPRTLQDYIDQPFLANLLALFHSEDPRERESLKTVYHRIYSRFSWYRALMRKAMSDVFLRYVFETERHSGIGELLEIWGSIINGFTVPIREEHKLFLMRVLIPLHKAKGMQAYHRQLAYCVSQFVQKEPGLGGVVVRGILRYWPVTNSHKEVLLIGELEELAENIDPGQYRKLAPLICNQITKCLNSPNSQVAERALDVWNNALVVKMASTAMKEVFAVVVAGMERNLKFHWSKSVKQLTENVKSMLEEMNPSLYAKCLGELELRESAALQKEIERRKRWDRIEMAAAQNQPQLNYVHVPQARPKTQ